VCNLPHGLTAIVSHNKRQIVILLRISSYSLKAQPHCDGVWVLWTRVSATQFVLITTADNHLDSGLGYNVERLGVYVHAISESHSTPSTPILLPLKKFLPVKFNLGVGVSLGSSVCL
jgi:hypothetical protein